MCAFLVHSVLSADLTSMLRTRAPIYQYLQASPSKKGLYLGIRLTPSSFRKITFCMENLAKFETFLNRVIQNADGTGSTDTQYLRRSPATSQKESDVQNGVRTSSADENSQTENRNTPEKGVSQTCKSQGERGALISTHCSFPSAHALNSDPLEEPSIEDVLAEDTPLVYPALNSLDNGGSAGADLTPSEIFPSSGLPAPQEIQPARSNEHRGESTPNVGRCSREERNGKACSDYNAVCKQNEEDQKSADMSILHSAEDKDSPTQMANHSSPQEMHNANPDEGQETDLSNAHLFNAEECSKLKCREPKKKSVPHGEFIIAQEKDGVSFEECTSLLLPKEMPSASQVLRSSPPVALHGKTPHNEVPSSDQEIMNANHGETRALPRQNKDSLNSGSVKTSPPYGKENTPPSNNKTTTNNSPIYSIGRALEDQTRKELMVSPEYMKIVLGREDQEERQTPTKSPRLGCARTYLHDGDGLDRLNSKQNSADRENAFSPSLDIQRKKNNRSPGTSGLHLKDSQNLERVGNDNETGTFHAAPLESNGKGITVAKIAKPQTVVFPDVPNVNNSTRTQSLGIFGSQRTQENGLRANSSSVNTKSRACEVCSMSSNEVACRTDGRLLCICCYSYKRRTGKDRPPELRSGKKRNIARVCIHCGETESRQWRRGPNKETLCSKCGNFFHRKGVMRPRHLIDRDSEDPIQKTDVLKPPRKLVRFGKVTSCSNCGSSQRGIWRAGQADLPTCDTCHSYWKRNRRCRPAELYRKKSKDDDLGDQSGAAEDTGT